MAEPLGLKGDIEKRLGILRAVAPYYGKILSASFLRKTSDQVPGVDRIHSLLSGIYKPKWSAYALSIASMLKSPYSDEVFYNADRTWWIRYSPKSGGMDIADNVSLLRCMSDKQPIMVLRQLYDKFGPEGAQHRLLGLGMIESFDAANDVFRIRGLDWDEVVTFLGIGVPDDLVETALRLESLEQWAPFEASNRAIYRVEKQRRDAAFSDIVLTNYDQSCAVTGLRFNSKKHTEAAAAHIIGKSALGTDDPRNGIALSQSVHWAFDRGIFTITDQFEVLINPKARSARIAAFPLMDLDRRPIQLPKDTYYRPHPEALEWHRKEVFEKFVL
jgi:hypothetical protein